MDEIVFENPIRTIKYKMTENEFKGHINKVVAKFPREYKIVREDQQKGTLTILYTPLNAKPQLTVNDLLISLQIVIMRKNINAEITATNQSNKIQSHTEEENQKKSLQTFTVLLEKSIRGTLNKSASNGISPQLKAQAALQAIVIIVAIIVIIYGLIAILK